MGKAARTGKQSTSAPVRSAGVLGTARWERETGHQGRPAAGEDRPSTASQDGGPGRESERGIVPSRPDNAGGGKAPCFRRAFEDGKVTVIGDEPGNAGQDQDPSEEALL